MCGIYGAASKWPLNSCNLEKIRKIPQIMAHRGPDASGEISDEKFFLGSMRLCIIDSKGGHQPMSCRDGDISIVFNGEIYNFLQLRQKLIDLGQSFETNSDTEVVLQGYKYFGLDFIRELHGMFSFAIIDRKKDLIHLGRDRLGEKPLYLFKRSGITYFSSEMRSLVLAEVAPFEIDKEATRDYLIYGYYLEPKSPILNVRKLERGTIESISLKDGQTTKTTYLNQLRKDSTNHARIQSLNFDQLLEKSIIDSTISDFPIGIALSSGIDSSIIASVVAGTKKVQCFSVGYDVRSKFDESSDASEFARHLGLPIQTKKISASAMAQEYETLCLLRDEPISDIAGYSYLTLGRMAHENDIKVLLTGQGGDELFWGYQWVLDAVPRIANSLQSIQGKRNFLRYLFSATFSRRHPFFSGIVLDIRGALDSIYFYFRDKSNANNLGSLPYLNEHLPKIRKKRRAAKKVMGQRDDRVYIPLVGNIEELTPEGLAIEQLLSTYFVSNGLAQVDRLFMASSIEGRTPLGANDLVEYALMRNGSELLKIHKKKLLKEYASKKLTPKIMNRKKKGFTPPVRIWYREIHRIHRTKFLTPRIVEEGIVNKSAKKVMRRPFTVLLRTRTGWLELVTLELWFRALERGLDSGRTHSSIQ